MNTVEQLRNFIIDNYFNDCSEFYREKLRNRENKISYFDYPTHRWPYLRSCLELGRSDCESFHEFFYKGQFSSFRILYNLLENKNLPDNLRNEIMMVTL